MVKTAISEKDKAFEKVCLFCEDESRFGLHPSYSPELNPIERLWQDIKAKLFQNAFATIKEIQDKLTKILRKYTKTTIQSITKYDYLRKMRYNLLELVLSHFQTEC